jgi:hypothetical protein
LAAGEQVFNKILREIQVGIGGDECLIIVEPKMVLDYDIKVNHPLAIFLNTLAEAADFLPLFYLALHS